MATKPKLTDKERARIVALYTRDRLTIHTIAQRMQVASSTVARVLDAAGVAIEPVVKGVAAESGRRVGARA